VLDTSRDVIRSLLTYTDWWQPESTSVLRVGGARRNSNEFGDGIPHGLLDSLDERAELCRRMGVIRHMDRRLLFLWYVRQLPVDDISRDLDISRRQCFRRRAAAIEALANREDAA
jgi:hypothetical protein